jgi:hypothetical protein
MSVKDIMGQDNCICEYYIAPRVTKGQLVAGNKHSQKTAVPVGEDGSFLQADSTAETGLRWVKLGEGELVTGKGSGTYTVPAGPTNSVLIANSAQPGGLQWSDIRAIIAANSPVNEFDPGAATPKSSPPFSPLADPLGGKAFYHPHPCDTSHLNPLHSLPQQKMFPSPSAPPLAVQCSIVGDVYADPELQPLADALVTLSIGVRNTCTAFALALSQEGVMSVADLRLLPEDNVRDMLSRVGMKELQQLKLMKAACPSAANAPSVTLSTSSAIFPATARPPECDWSALKRDGFTAQELLRAGCSADTLLELGYDLRGAGFTARELRLAGCSLAKLVALGYDSVSLRQAGFS